MKKLNMNIQFFANAVLRDDAEALIEAQISNEIIKGVIGQSAILKHAKRLPDMTSNETVLNVEDVLPVAGFVNGDVGLKPTSDASWKNVKVTSEEIAVIIPFSENVLDDANYDLIGQLKPRIEEAFGKVIDGAGLFGVNIPVSWGQGLVQKATSAGNVVPYSADDTLYTRIDKTMAKVEEDGFVANAILGSVKLKSGFRNMVDKNGQPIQGTEIDSISRDYVVNGSWDDTKATFITGDFNNLVYAIRQDITYKLLDQAVISDESGKIVYNLAQNDMLALRVKMRLGIATPNPTSRLNESESTRFPFAVALPQA